MSANPAISVIVPVYNGAPFLANAIRNILDQEYTPLEIIVVDDGSTDDTPQIAASFGSAIRYERQPNSGPAAARNTGIRLAAGELIAFLDADDEWPRRRLRRAVAALAQNPAAAIVQGMIVRIEREPGAAGQFEECSEPYQFVNLGSAVFRRAVFEQVGLFDERLRENEDTDWFFRAWEANVAKVVQDSVALYYRRHSANMTAEGGYQHLKIARVIKLHLDRYRSAGRAALKSPDLPNLATYIGLPPANDGPATVADENFTIIANDCWASGPYSHLRLPYRTPFIGTRIFGPCYLELLGDLRGYLAQPLHFITTSRYGFMNAHRDGALGRYPLALLGGNVEVHFIHEADEASARRKWERRCAKIAWDNLYLKFSQDVEVPSRDLLDRFDRLPYPYKVAFTRDEHPLLRSTIAMPDYFAPGAPMYYLSRRYFDTIAWLNKSNGSDTQAYQL